MVHILFYNTSILQTLRFGQKARLFVRPPVHLPVRPSICPPCGWPSDPAGWPPDPFSWPSDPAGWPSNQLEGSEGLLEGS